MGGAGCGMGGAGSGWAGPGAASFPRTRRKWPFSAAARPEGGRLRRRQPLRSGRRPAVPAAREEEAASGRRAQIGRARQLTIPAPVSGQTSVSRDLCKIVCPGRSRSVGATRDGPLRGGSEWAEERRPAAGVADSASGEEPPRGPGVVRRPQPGFSPWRCCRVAPHGSLKLFFRSPGLVKLRGIF